MVFERTDLAGLKEDVQPGSGWGVKFNIFLLLIAKNGNLVEKIVILSFFGFTLKYSIDTTILNYLTFSLENNP